MRLSALTILKILVALVVVQILMIYLESVAVGYYDLHEKKTILEGIAKELPAHASMDGMMQFLKAHTARYACNDMDGEQGHSCGGIMAQTTFDRLWFNRQVQIRLNYDANKTFVGADVQVFYTFL